MRNLEGGPGVDRYIDTGLRDIHADKDGCAHGAPPCRPSLHNAGSRPSQLFGLVTGGTGRPELTHGLPTSRPGSLRSVPLPSCHDARPPLQIQGLAIAQSPREPPRLPRITLWRIVPIVPVNTPGHQRRALRMRRTQPATDSQSPTGIAACAIARPDSLWVRTPLYSTPQLYHGSTSLPIRLNGRDH